MSVGYVLDACALIAFFNLQIYYGLYRLGGESLAEETYASISRLPLKVVAGMRRSVFKEAGRLKATYRISLADSIALAEAKTRQVSLVTCDHHEFDVLEKNSEASFYWIR